MANDNVILRFSNVSFEYEHDHKLLEEASFSVRTGSRITLMGQNGAGKSTIFKLITRELAPTEGSVFLTPADATIGIARQVMPKAMLGHTVREYFASAFTEQKYNLDKLIAEVCEVVHLSVPFERHLNKCSGGQRARLLLAHALIQHPDVLLLDEPTNNLDAIGIEHLTGFLMAYEKTCVVISHDADFLNAFSDGVLYLDAFNHTIEQYTGNYSVVVEEIKNRIERENLQNARLAAQVREKRAQAEVFAHKGGKLRSVAKRMRQVAETAEEQMVDVRREDKVIRPFTIPVQALDRHFDGQLIAFRAVTALKNHAPVRRPLDLTVRKDTHVLLAGPNGVGKSTLLERLNAGGFDDAVISPEVRVGYYKQDFSNLDPDLTAFAVLKAAMERPDEHLLRSAAAGFLLDGKLLSSPIRALSEGQKGLLSFCRLVLLAPAVLLLDEPTNHINFRHLPIIAQALDQYAGGMVLVSHLPDFVAQIRIDEVIDLGD
ncbi:MAG: ABC transporter, ATP-binding protein [Parcubacteria group bacterium Gr01-1014_31]|nr:MAG: ABC transporter, ATP-binding protein [Parcubacteria group bacterium Gr01-1014_31]